MGKELERIFNFYIQMDTGRPPDPSLTLVGKLIQFAEVIHNNEELRKRFSRDYYAKFKGE